MIVESPNMTKPRQDPPGGRDTARSVGRALHAVRWPEGIRIRQQVVPADGGFHSLTCSPTLFLFAHSSGGIGVCARDVVEIERDFLVLTNDAPTPEAGLVYVGSVHVPGSDTTLHLMERP